MNKISEADALLPDSALEERRWPQKAPKARAFPGYVLCIIPAIIALLSVFGPFVTDTMYLDSGLAYDVRPGYLPGYPNIEPNAGAQSYSLGVRATKELLAGHLPLWNHYEGLGTPLLGEMNSAALFPFTWLMAFPYGQQIERAVLELLGGLGAYLFFRAYGLRVAASLVGALLYEVNGVFAWLHNAIFNPVAFLPWLGVTIEYLRMNALAGSRLRSRLPVICLGATMAALAIYAGFPEETYLYSLFLVVWTAIRFIGLSRHQASVFARDLFATAAVALALSAPVLVAFVTFLMEATTGRHAEGFYGAWLLPLALLQYAMPYVFGPIFAAPGEVGGTFGGIGGYIGFLPIVAAVGTLLVGRHHLTKWTLLAWTLIALGASHGWPVVYEAFMALPLARIAAVFRYITLSWIFCAIFLTALFVDQLSTMSLSARRAVATWSLLGAAIVLAVIVHAAWASLVAFWTSQPHLRPSTILSAAAVAIFGGGTWVAIRIPNVDRAVKYVGVLLVAEAALAYFVPFLSYPKAGRLDTGAIAFLQDHVGFQRIMETLRAEPDAGVKQGYELGPNYGSALGIPDLMYNDLPVPQRTPAYINKHLDPDSAGTAYAAPSPLQIPRMPTLRNNLPRFAHAGVKYMLASADYYAIPAFALKPGPARLLELKPGDEIEFSGTRPADADATISAVTVGVGARSRDADGHMHLMLCHQGDCASASAEIRVAHNGRPLLFVLDHALAIPPGESYTVHLERKAGGRAFSVALQELNPGVHAESNTLPLGFAPNIGFISRSDQVPVYSGPAVSIYEVPGTRSYFSAPGCEVTATDWDHADLVCSRESTLTRLELVMRGWAATINGQPAPILAEDDTFQTVRVPAGSSHIAFAYAPPGFRMALVAACAALTAIVLGFALALRSRWTAHKRGGNFWMWRAAERGPKFTALSRTSHKTARCRS